MKGSMLLFIAIVFCLNLAGQKPESLFFQAPVRDEKGQLVINKPVSFRMSILAGSPSGITIYSELQKETTNKEGLVSIVVGTGTNKISNLNTIDWNAGQYFLKTEYDLSGGSSYREMSTTQILNVPFEAQNKATRRPTELVMEDEFLMTRKFIGQFIDYRHTGPETSDGPNIIWIKTTLDKTYGKLSAYGKSCDFHHGDNLYVRRIYFSPGDVSGYWIYQVENDSAVYYRLSEFQYDKKVYAETLFLQ